MRLSLGVLLLAMGCFAASGQAQDRGIQVQPAGNITVLPGASKRFALLIGVDRYSDAQIGSLHGAANDARLLRDALVAHAGFPAEHVIVLASDQAAERQPTRGNILRRLSNLATVVPKDGLLLFAFAGHGIERSRQAFLLPSDAQLSDDTHLLDQTALSVGSIADWLHKTAVGQVILILDACRNDPGGRAHADNPLSEAYTHAFQFDIRNRGIQAFTTLYATGLGARAYEYTEKRHGYFTWSLVEGLQGAAANAQGEVTLGQLISYLQERVPKQVLLDLGAGKKQVPWAVVEGYRANDLVLAVPQAGAVAPQAALTPLVETPAQRAPTAAEPRTLGDPTALAGMTWEGTTVYGDFIMEFLDEGKLRYTLLSNRKPVQGTWKKHGNSMFMSVGFTVWEGQLEAGIMRGEASSHSGEKYRWQMTPRAK